mmetsp:Transcript_132344/g.295968  ORF Transcript_132344/g.295968 Transcript_132344/m.295968 type:complete len:341 (+) Transcript_132344:230-1252(+)
MPIIQDGPEGSLQAHVAYMESREHVGKPCIGLVPIDVKQLTKLIMTSQVKRLLSKRVCEIILQLCLHRRRHLGVRFATHFMYLHPTRQRKRRFAFSRLGLDDVLKALITNLKCLECRFPNLFRRIPLAPINSGRKHLAEFLATYLQGVPFAGLHQCYLALASLRAYHLLKLLIPPPQRPQSLAPEPLFGTLRSLALRLPILCCALCALCVPLRLDLEEQGAELLATRLESSELLLRGALYTGPAPGFPAVTAQGTVVALPQRRTSLQAQMLAAAPQCRQLKLELLEADVSGIVTAGSAERPPSAKAKQLRLHLQTPVCEAPTLTAPLPCTQAAQCGEPPF